MLTIRYDVSIWLAWSEWLVSFHLGFHSSTSLPESIHLLTRTQLSIQTYIQLHIEVPQQQIGIPKTTSEPVYTIIHALHDLHLNGHLHEIRSHPHHHIRSCILPFHRLWLEVSWNSEDIHDPQLHQDQYLQYQSHLASFFLHWLMNQTDEDHMDHVEHSHEDYEVLLSIVYVIMDLLIV